MFKVFIVLPDGSIHKLKVKKPINSESDAMELAKDLSKVKDGAVLLESGVILALSEDYMKSVYFILRKDD